MPGTSDQQSVNNSPTLPDDLPVTVASSISVLTTIGPATVTVSWNSSGVCAILLATCNIIILAPDTAI